MAISPIGSTIDMDEILRTVDNNDFELDDARVVHVWQNAINTVSDQIFLYFSIYDIDGNQLAAPQRVSADPGVPPAGLMGFVEPSMP